jgi:type IV secretory pathway VirJ component
MLIAAAAAYSWMQSEPAVQDLTASAYRKDASIVFVSGDAGLPRWSLGKQVAQQLAAEDYAVTAVDSLSAFSKRRSPEQTGAILAAAMNEAIRRNPGAPVVLLGHSFGSDIIPIAVAYLPANLRSRITRIILTVPATQAYLQVSPAEMLGTARPDLPLLPFVRQLPPVPLTCIYGIQERDSLCRMLAGPKIHSVALPGGHALHRDGDAVLAAVDRALRGPPAGMTKA